MELYDLSDYSEAADPAITRQLMENPTDALLAAQDTFNSAVDLKVNDRTLSYDEGEELKRGYRLKLVGFDGS